MSKTFSQFRSELPIIEYVEDSQEYFAEDLLSEDLFDILANELNEDTDRIVSVLELYSRDLIDLSEDEIEGLVAYYEELEEAATVLDVGKAALGAGARLAKKYGPSVVQAGKSALSKAGQMAKSAISSAGSKIKSAFSSKPSTPGTSVVPYKAPVQAKAPSKIGSAIKSAGKTAGVAAVAGGAGYLAGKSSSPSTTGGSARPATSVGTSSAPKAGATAPKSVAPKSVAPKAAPKSVAPKASSGGGVPDDVRDAAKNMLGATRGAAGATGNMVNKMKAIPGTDRMNKPVSPGGQTSSQIRGAISKLGGEPTRAAPKAMPSAPVQKAAVSGGAPTTAIGSKPPALDRSTARKM